MPFRHESENAEIGLNKLLEMGVLSEERLEAFGKLVHQFASFGALGPATSTSRPTGSEQTSRRTRRRGAFTLSKAELKQLYITEGLSAKAIAERLGVSAQTVSIRASKWGLKKRGTAAATTSKPKPKRVVKKKKVRAKKAKKARAS